MKSALKKSVVSTSISLILASGMAAFAAHAADDRLFGGRGRAC